jgi:hypothetical protein
MIDKFKNVKNKQVSWPEDRYRCVDSEGMHKFLDDIPKELANDYYLRLAMENVLSWSHDEILDATKLIQEYEVVGVYFMDLIKPIYLPTAYAYGTHNEQLKLFASHAYEVLQHFFGSSEWGDWFLLPHYQPGKDTFEDVTLGVFINKNEQQVLE